MISTLKELGTFLLANLEIVPPFGLSTFNHLEFCINARNTAEIIQLCFDIQCEDNVNACVSHALPPSRKPTQSVCKDPTKLYNSATETQKQELALNSLLLPEVAMVSPEACFISTALAPTCPSDCGRYSSLLATLSNYGVLQVMRKGLINRTWTELVDLTFVWQQYTRKHMEEDEPSTDFNAFLQQSENLQLVAFDWLHPATNPSTYSIVCTTAKRKCIFFYIDNGSATVSFVTDLEQEGRINHVRWLSVDDQQSFLCTANAMGSVRLYRVTCDKDTHRVVSVELEASLLDWKMACHFERLMLEFDAETKTLIAVVCIGSRMVFCVAPNDNLQSFQTSIHVLDQQSITGICTLSPFSYVVCTNGGVVQRVTVNSEGAVASEAITTNINSEKYLTLGVGVTKQQAVWFFVLFPRQPLDHLVIRFPVTISFCSPPSSELWTTLITNPTLSMSGYIDCIEGIRLNQMRNDQPMILPKLLDDLTVDLDDDAFLYKLRLQFMLLATRFSYVRRNEGPTELKSLTSEYDYVRNTINAVVFYRRMIITAAETPKSWTPEQATSISNIMAFLDKYSADTAHPKYEDIAVNIATYLSVGRELWYTADNQFESQISEERCHHCDGLLAAGSLECAEGHLNPRCCITYLQLPLLCSRSCTHCGNMAHDVDVIEDVFTDVGAAQVCPVCDVNLVTSFYV